MLLEYIVAGAIGAISYEALRSWTTEQTDDRDPRELYVDGEISHAEFAHRTDPVTQEIREVAASAPGIDDALAEQVAREFDSVAALRTADRDRLQEVPDIGPKRAKALHEAIELQLESS